MLALLTSPLVEGGGGGETFCSLLGTLLCSPRGAALIARTVCRLQTRRTKDIIVRGYDMGECVDAPGSTDPGHRSPSSAFVSCLDVRVPCPPCALFRTPNLQQTQQNERPVPCSCCCCVCGAFTSHSGGTLRDVIPLPLLCPTAQTRRGRETCF